MTWTNEQKQSKKSSIDEEKNTEKKTGDYIDVIIMIVHLTLLYFVNYWQKLFIYCIVYMSHYHIDT